MDYKKRWTTGALKDLESIRDYVDRNNPYATDGVLARIIETIELLQSSPRLGVLSQIIPEGEVRALSADSFRIYYMPFDDAKIVRVMAIRHVKWEEPDFSE